MVTKNDMIQEIVVSEIYVFIKKYTIACHFCKETDPYE